MSPTRPGILAVLFTAGAAVMFVAEMALVRMGEPVFTPPISLAVTLILIGGLLPALAWPIRQATHDSDQQTRQRDHSGRRPAVNPFYAMRVLLLAKAGSLTGALLTGVGVGVAVFFLGRMVVVWDSVIVAAVTGLGGVLLVVGSLLAERWCQIPPSDDDNSAVEGELA
ncbi:DUF3180 domain-containing protein [Pontimonas sp.]|uniref:DUF3180 domain-containing protein n=1 Tax=Pontimonas sp. TaxID=2304492 RepID=UPI00286FC272|nr:DUF3180 domain-containing protein [Pontimonas sp.]MDR9396425.1 DUF3180 domain-containing protein [Pontimonas sp.]MDR9434757.1 DUF3180 domain-containing protein [Pontimonas sp.]